MNVSERARKMHFRLLVAAIAGSAMIADVRADINPSQVLVVFNGQASGANEVLQAYIAAHPDLPPENILNLDNALITGPDLSWSDFTMMIRDPIRSYLSAPGDPTPEGIIAIVLLRPFPHRLLDTDNGTICDTVSQVGNELTSGDATCAALDADLVLLWQDLGAGEAGGTMDSLLDNMIANPYHKSTTPISSFPRTEIQAQHAFENLGNVVWGTSAAANRLRPGDMYLVCRIDGNSTDDAIALIARSQRLLANKQTATMLFDEYDTSISDDLDDDGLFTSGDPFNAGDDYEETTSLLTTAGWNVIYDNTFDFITGIEVPTPLLGYASYGENHSLNGAGENPPGNGTYIEDFNFIPGAVFNTIESFNGRALNGRGTLFNQEQVADFVASGGTFAIGNVWEPFTFTIADNEYILPRMLTQSPTIRFTWAEAAYSSLPALSWQQIVIGDPLGRFDVVNDPAPLPGDLDNNGVIDGADADLFALLLLDGYADYRAMFPLFDPYARADFTGDYLFDSRDLPGFVDAFLNQ